MTSQSQNSLTTYGSLRHLNWLCLVLLSLCCLLLNVARSQTPRSNNNRRPSRAKERRYDQGPLKLSEFRRNTTNSIPGRAKTMTRVMYSYRMFGKQTASKQFEVELRSMEVYAVFLPNESWWNHPPSEALLDHEQGHFDIAEITARRLRLSFEKALKSRNSIRGVGRTLESAQKALDTKLKKVVELANKQSSEENLEYDTRTAHGSFPIEQTEFRRIQMLTLKRLGKQLEPAPNRSKSSGSAGRTR